jgi:hypothetical protein
MRWRCGSRLRRLRPLAALAALLLLWPVAEAQTSEYRVKAAFLLNFTRFVEWPPAAFDGSGAPLTICILGNDPFGNTLDHLVEGESAGGRKLETRRIQEPPRPKACQLLFVGRQEKDIADLIDGLGPGVLTVGEGEPFLRDGGMIAFVLEARHVRFDINQRAADKASLTLSSRLLSVARAVQK